MAVVRRLGIVGAGQMGTGIAIVAALTGAAEQVAIFDSNKHVSDAAMQFAESHYTRAVSKDRISAADKTSALSRLKVLHSLNDLSSSCDFIVEAASEVPETKLAIFHALDEATNEETILASNTSSISITRIAAATSKPERVVGMHFFNPVPVMKLVELVPGLATSVDTAQKTAALAGAMGKTVAHASDSPGFVSNRVLMPYINEAIIALTEGVASREDIDTVMKLGTAVPMGPLTLADFIGLDTCLSILRVLHADLGQDKYAPAPLLVRHVQAGWLGRKTGRGFYTYDANGKPT